MLALLGLCLRQNCTFLMLAFSVKNNILDGINNKGDCHQCQIINFLKISILKRSIKKYTRSRCHKKTYGTKIYDNQKTAYPPTQ